MAHPLLTLHIRASDSARDRLVDELAGVTLVEGEDEADFRLEETTGGWRLRDREGLALQIDFDASGPDYRRGAPRGRQELIARAVGSKQNVRRVLDLTAGLGQDAVFLSQLGFTVTAIERNPLLAFLLRDARARTQRTELRDLRFECGDAREWLSRTDLSSSFDAAYFDPMYPTKKKSALPRQEMRLFRSLVGIDEDAADVVRQALATDLSRLTVKRPLEAPPLVEGVRHSFEGKTVRYDVYVR